MGYRGTPRSDALSTTVVWLRHSLRLSDHAPFAHAAERGRVVPVFVWSPDEEGAWPPGGAHRWWLHHSLQALDKDLRSRGSRLVLRHGDALGELAAVCEAAGADRVVWQTRYEPALRERDDKVKEGLAEAGVEARQFAGRILHDPDQVQTGSGGPYKVFTPFWNRFKDEVTVDEPLGRPRLGKTSAPNTWPDSVELESLELTDQAQDGVRWADGMADEWTPGEAGALDRLATFLDRDLLDYPKGRDQPAARDTSMLSPHLHWGEISPRTVWTETEARVTNGATRQAADKFLSEVGWREFSYHVLYHFPRTPSAPLKEKYAKMPWRQDAGALQAWQRGQTGYPLVDAGMRQLWAIGWMHNRMRMVTASFPDQGPPDPLAGRRGVVLGHLGGRRPRQQLDGLAVGRRLRRRRPAVLPHLQPDLPVQKARPRRRLHPPVGPRSWRTLPTKHLHAPWDAPADVLEKAGVTLGETYPRPIVDHADARDAALAALKRVNE